jgi:hypothetical protein
MQHFDNVLPHSPVFIFNPFMVIKGITCKKMTMMIIPLLYAMEVVVNSRRIRLCNSLAGS